MLLAPSKISLSSHQPHAFCASSCWLRRGQQRHYANCTVAAAAAHNRQCSLITAQQARLNSMLCVRTCQAASAPAASALRRANSTRAVPCRSVGSAGSIASNAAADHNHLYPAAAAQLRQHLQQLLPLQAAAETPTAALLRSFNALLQPVLHHCPPRVLLGVARLSYQINYSPSTAWWQSLQESLQQHAEQLDPDSASGLLAGLLLLQHRQQQLGSGQLHRQRQHQQQQAMQQQQKHKGLCPSMIEQLAAAVLADITQCNSHSIAALLTAVALAGPGSSYDSDSSSSSSSRLAAIDSSTGTHNVFSPTGSNCKQGSSAANLQAPWKNAPSAAEEPAAAAAAEAAAAAATRLTDHKDIAQLAATTSSAGSIDKVTGAARVAQVQSSSASSSKCSSANSSHQHRHGSSSSSSSTGGLSQQALATTACSELLNALMLELSQPGRLAGLHPGELIAVPVAAAALQLQVPRGWMNSFLDALQQQLPRQPAHAIAALTMALPVLLPPASTGRLKNWQKLGKLVAAATTVIASSGAAADGRNGVTAAQLCELLGLAHFAELALPVETIERALGKVQTALPSLSMQQSSKALIAAQTLNHKLPKVWLEAYLTKLQTGFYELGSEQVVEVLRALSAAGLLPDMQWLLAVEQDVSHRFDVLSPSELTSAAFLLANLNHCPSEPWKERFVAVALKHRQNMFGSALTQLVWAVVKLKVRPSRQWLGAYVAQMECQLAQLQVYELSFTIGALQKLGAPLAPQFIDAVLDAFALRLPAAAPSDVALLLVTVAQLQHVTSYRWLDDMLDHCQERMMQFDGQELVSIMWSLAKLHHQPGSEWLHIAAEAAEPQLDTLTGNQMAQLLWSFAELQWEPPAAWMKAFLDKCQAHMASDAVTSKNAAAVLGSLAALSHAPTETWLQTCLNLIYWRMNELDSEGLASVPISLVKLDVVVANEGPWLSTLLSLSVPRLSGMSAESLSNFLAALAVFRAEMPKAWVAAYQLACIQRAEEGKMSAGQLEQVVVSLSSLCHYPSRALCQLYYNASLPILQGMATAVAGSSPAIAASAPRRSAVARPVAIAAVLQALDSAQIQPDAKWLQQVVEVVRGKLCSYTLLQLSVVAKSLSGFEARGMKHRWLSDFVAYLKEFVLYN